MVPTWVPGAAAGASVRGLSLWVQTEGSGPGGEHGRSPSPCKAEPRSPCRVGYLPEEEAEAGPAGQGLQGGPSRGSHEDLTTEASFCVQASEPAGDWPCGAALPWNEGAGLLGCFSGLGPFLTLGPRLALLNLSCFIFEQQPLEHAGECARGLGPSVTVGSDGGGAAARLPNQPPGCERRWRTQSKAGPQGWTLCSTS